MHNLFLRCTGDSGEYFLGTITIEEAYGERPHWMCPAFSKSFNPFLTHLCCLRGIVYGYEATGGTLGSVFMSIKFCIS